MCTTWVARHARWWSGMIFIVLYLTPSVFAQESRIETIAGTGRDTPGQAGRPLATNIGNPFGVEWGPDGDLYICEVSNHRVWRLSRPRNSLSIVAGTGRQGYSGDGGPATRAALNEPYEVRFDATGNMYFVEMQNHVVRRVDRASGTITTIAGTGTAGYRGDGHPATQSLLSRPHSIALDDRGYLYIADIGNHRIRRVHLQNGTIDSVAGNGEKRLPRDGQLAKGNPVLGPRALFITGRTLWVALREGHSVWKLDLDQGRWHHVAGTGKPGYTGDGQTASRATFNGPKGISVDGRGDLYVVDTENHAVRRIDADTGIIQTLAGSGPHRRGYAGDGGASNLAELNRPHGVCVTSDGLRIIIGDSQNHRVRQVTISTK